MKMIQKMIWMLAAAGLLAVSCVAEKAEPAPAADADEITAGIEVPGTRTYTEDLQVLWGEGDLISVFPGRNVNSKYVLKSEPGKTFGTFTKVNGSLTGPSLPGYAAVYPYAEDVSVETDGTVSLTLPAEQTYAENSFGPGANTMVSWSNSGYLPFKNVCGFFVMSLTGNVEINSIEFVGGAQEILAGPATVVPGEKEDFVLTFDKAATDTSILLTCPEPVILDAKEPTEFWIVVPPASYGMGIYVKITYNGDKVLREGSAEKTVPIIRNQVYRMENLDITVEDGIPAEECVDLTTALTWPIMQEWGENGTLLPSTHADLAWAEWVWGQNCATYPEGYPTFGYNDKKSMNQVRCVWKEDGLVLNVPVLEIPAGSKLAFSFSWRAGGQAPKCWAVEACLDGETWVPMDLVGTVENSVNISYQEKDGTEAVAPFVITKKDTAHPFEATLGVTEAVKRSMVQVRVRAISTKRVGDGYADAPDSVKNCHVYIPSAFTLQVK